MLEHLGALARSCCSFLVHEAAWQHQYLPVLQVPSATMALLLLCRLS